MILNRIRNFLYIAVLLSLGAGSVYAAAEGAMPMSHDDLTKRSIREKISVLRNERIEKMPYLDNAIVKDAINEEDVRQKMAFIQSGGQKALEELISRAVEVNTSAKVARKRISLTKHRIFAVMRELFPEINYTFQHRDGTLSSSPFNSSNWNVSFRQPIFRGGVLWNTVMQEKAELEASMKEYEQEISDIMNDVSAAYFEYNRSMEDVFDQQTTIEKVRRFVSMSNQKWDEEIISEIEHLNVQSLFSQMKYDFESSKQELELSKLELQKYLGLGIDHTVDIRQLYDLDILVAEEAQMPTDEYGSGIMPEDMGYGVEEGSEVPNIEVLVDLAYENRPELQVEAAKLKSARLEEKIRWGELLPHLDLLMEVGKLGEAFNDASLDPKFRKEFRLLMELSWNAAGNNMRYTFENDSNAPSVSHFQAGSGSQTTRNQFEVGILDGLDDLVDARDAEVEKLEQIVELEDREKEVIQDVKQGYFDYQRALIQVKSTLKRVSYRQVNAISKASFRQQ